jgi:hypothetical protein
VRVYLVVMTALYVSWALWVTSPAAAREPQTIAVVNWARVSAEDENPRRTVTVVKVGTTCQAVFTVEPHAGSSRSYAVTSWTVACP